MFWKRLNRRCDANVLNKLLNEKCDNIALHINGVCCCASTCICCCSASTIKWLYSTRIAYARTHKYGSDSCLSLTLMRAAKHAPMLLCCVFLVARRIELENHVCTHVRHCHGLFTCQQMVFISRAKHQKKCRSFDVNAGASEEPVFNTGIDPNTFKVLFNIIRK